MRPVPSRKCTDCQSHSFIYNEAKVLPAWHCGGVEFIWQLHLWPSLIEFDSQGWLMTVKQLLLFLIYWIHQRSLAVPWAMWFIDLYPTMFELVLQWLKCILFSIFFLIHDYSLYVTGSPCCNVSYYNYISIWPYYIVMH